MEYGEHVSGPGQPVNGHVVNSATGETMVHSSARNSGRPLINNYHRLTTNYPMSQLHEHNEQPMPDGWWRLW